ncbi:kelch-like protein 4 isoform X2 [Zeugodacus cucurbitae]|nr:kelch-like protein 4 isoform X2 [Zeugodacus cucurbitae]
MVLQLEDAVTICMDFIMAHIDEFTLEGVYALVKRKIHEYEIQNCMEISQSDEFLNFDVEKLQCLLESDNLNVTCEEDAYDAITRWFNHDVSARQEHLSHLVACLRLTQFGVDFLLNHIQSLPGCELLALQAYQWISNPSARTRINMRFTEPRVGLGARNCDEKTLLLVYEEVYGIQWLGVRGTFAYSIMGGSDYGCRFKSVKCYNPDSNSWSKCADMTYIHAEPTVATHNGHIYVVGDYKGPPVVERYDPQRDTWSQICSLDDGYRGSRACVSFYNKLWTIGGSLLDGSTVVAVYNEANDFWEMKRPLAVGRISSCFVVSLSLLTSIQ